MAASLRKQGHGDAQYPRKLSSASPRLSEDGEDRDISATLGLTSTSKRRATLTTVTMAVDPRLEAMAVTISTKMTGRVFPQSMTYHQQAPPV